MSLRRSGHVLVFEPWVKLLCFITHAFVLTSCCYKPDVSSIVPNIVYVQCRICLIITTYAVGMDVYQDVARLPSKPIRR